MIYVNYRVSSESSREPAVSTVGLGSESPTGSVASEEVFRPRFTIDPHQGSCSWLSCDLMLSLVLYKHPYGQLSLLSLAGWQMNSGIWATG